MSLRNEFEKSGSWLFCHRSFLAFTGLPIIVAGLSSFTYLGGSHLVGELWNAVCLLVSCSGLAVRVLAVGHAPLGTSGRNTSEQVARTLTTTGIYSVVRHPLYLGNYLVVLGVAMFFHTWWMIVLVTCLYALYYERIMFAEESFLEERFGEAFKGWAGVTPSIIPRLGLWRPAALPFSWRTVLRREYTGFFLVTNGFFLLEVIGGSVAEGRLRIDWPWVMVALVGATVYVTLRSLKKSTRLLHEAGR